VAKIENVATESGVPRVTLLAASTAWIASW
jgi:hypothetical protein